MSVAVFLSLSRHNFLQVLDVSSKFALVPEVLISIVLLISLIQSSIVFNCAISIKTYYIKKF